MTWCNENISQFDPHSSFVLAAKVAHGESIYVMSHGGHMYCFNLTNWNEELVQTASSTPILALTFARGTDELLIIGEHEKVTTIILIIYIGF